MKPRFLLDENIEGTILRQMRRQHPTIEVITVGEFNAPPFQTSDLDLLDWIQENNYILVTHDRRSMPAHLTTHYEKGGRLPGVLLIRRYATIRQVVDYLGLVGVASDMSEYQDVILYIP